MLPYDCDFLYAAQSTPGVLLMFLLWNEVWSSSLIRKQKRSLFCFPLYPWNSPSPLCLITVRPYNVKDLLVQLLLHEKRKEKPRYQTRRARWRQCRVITTPEEEQRLRREKLDQRAVGLAQVLSAVQQCAKDERDYLML